MGNPSPSRPTSQHVFDAAWGAQANSGTQVWWRARSASEKHLATHFRVAWDTLRCGLVALA